MLFRSLSVRRDNGDKKPLPLADIGKNVAAFLEVIQDNMFNRAKEQYWSRVKEVTDWKDVVPTLDNKCIVVLPWCEVEACEDDIKERSGKS